MEIQKTTFLILGGGIAGLTTAIALQNIGVNALVAEATPEFKPVGAGLVLAANAMKVYKHLGLYDEVSNAGCTIEQFAIKDQHGKTINRTTTTDVGDDTSNIAIHRGALHNVLLEQLESNNVLNGRRTLDIQTSEEGYKVVFENERIILAKYVIVAEGIHSVVRDKLFPNSEKRYAGYTCWRGITSHAKFAGLTNSETWGANGRFGIIPLGNGKVYWFAVKNSVANNEKYMKYGVEEIYQEFKDYHDPIPELINHTSENDIIYNDINDLKPISKYAKDNVVLIGDAAHATTPNMGQGACQAIEDAAVLANCIHNNSVIADAFSAFEKKRIDRTHHIVNQSWKMGRVAQWENKFMISLRNGLFRLLPKKFYTKQLEKVYKFEL